MDRYTDPAYLSDVVRFDLPLLGDITGLRGVHLQCHLGTDTLSLARLGASMTGLDFSGASVEVARALSARCGPAVTSVESEVYRAAAVLDPGSFDLVFTGIGAICWLHDIRRWAAVVAELLATGGRLFLREGHPVMWALDDERDDDLLVLGYPYFEHDTVPWEALPGKMTRVADGEWQISERPERLPHTYNLQARKPC